MQDVEDGKEQALRELMKEKEEIQNFSELVLEEKDLLRRDLIGAKDENARFLREENKMVKQNEELKNTVAIQIKDIDTWKLKYRSLKKEINGLKK